jgi:hypothetical protein
MVKKYIKTNTLEKSTGCFVALLNGLPAGLGRLLARLCAFEVPLCALVPLSGSPASS